MYEEIGDVDRVKMYKMIGALLRYDYFSAKCLVELLIEKRKDKEQELQRINEELKQQQEEIKALDNKDEIIKKSKPIVSDIG